MLLERSKKMITKEQLLKRYQQLAKNRSITVTFQNLKVTMEIGLFKIRDLVYGELTNPDDKDNLSYDFEITNVEPTTPESTFWINLIINQGQDLKDLINDALWENEDTLEQLEPYKTELQKLKAFHQLLHSNPTYLEYYKELAKGHLSYYVDSEFLEYFK